MALGYKEEYGYNYDQTYSPIMQDISFKLIILMTLKKSWTLNKVDIKTAFLNTQLDEEVFISLPEGIEQVGVSREGKIAKLNAALYGLKQASRKFFLEISMFLKENMNLDQSAADACIFTKDNFIEGLYVDYILYSGNRNEIKEF